MFNSSSEQTPKGLRCADTVVYLRKAIKNYFKLVLVNNSNHDIFLRKNTVLGHLDYVSSLIPLKVKNVEMLSNKVPEKDSVFANIITSNLEQPQKLSENTSKLMSTRLIFQVLHMSIEKRKESFQEMKVMYFLSVVMT